MFVFRLVRILSLVAVAAALGISHTASASTFDGIGNHTLTSNNLSFTSAGLGAGWACSSSTWEVNVASTTVATVTSVAFSSCTGTDALAGVPSTLTVTNLPWRVTPVGDGIVIDGIHIVLHFPAVGLSLTLAGNLAGGTVNNPTHTVTYNNGTGLTATAIPGPGSAPATVSGDFRDDQGTLTVTT